jgi:hypothetical protein
MEPVVLDPLPWTVAPDALAERLRMRPESGLRGELGEILARTREIVRPKAIYRLAFIEECGPDWVVLDGFRFTSRVLSVNLAETERVFVYICTAGHELEQWGQAQADLLHQYYAIQISEAALYSARRAFGAYLRDRYAVDNASEMNPGSLPDWPLREQRVLFDMLGDPEGAIGVDLLSTYLMRPAKTVSGLLFTAQDSHLNCRLCPRDVCQNRRAEYDPALYATKYGR